MRISLTQTLAAIIGAGSFWLSFTALSDLAVTHHIAAPDQGWVFALIIDATIIAATRAVVVLEAHRWYAWSLLALSAGISTAGNMAHVWQHGPVSIAGAAVPPLLLLAVAHLCVLRSADRPNPAPTAPPARERFTVLGPIGDPNPTTDIAVAVRERMRTAA